jgi:thiol-disulfide isomerase/thioredoxin
MISMSAEKMPSKMMLKKAGNVLFIVLLLFFVFNTDAKSWVLRQLVSIGLFNAEIKKDAHSKDPPQNDLSFSFSDTNGKQISTADLKDKVVFINFWASWCPPCRAEMPSLHALYNKFKDDKRFVFLFISEDDDLSKARSYLQKKEFDIPLTVSTGIVPSQIFSGTLPTTVVLDKEGKLVLKQEGIAGYNTPGFIQQLKDLL